VVLFLVVGHLVLLVVVLCIVDDLEVDLCLVVDLLDHLVLLFLVDLLVRLVVVLLSLEVDLCFLLLVVLLVAPYFHFSLIMLQL
jgi:hypothetical protein